MNLKENELKGMLKDKKMKSLELVDLFRSRKKVKISLFRGL